MDTQDTTKKRLIRTMMDLMQRQGFHATGISQVLAESQAPKGVLYHHFPGGKTELAATAVRQAGQRMVAGLQRFRDQSADPAEAVALFVNFYIAQLEATNYQRGCPIATVALETAASVDAIQVELKHIFEAMTDFLAESLAQHGLDAAAAHMQATVLVALTEGALLISRARRDPEPLQMVLRYLETQLRPLLAKPGAGPAPA